ncbi:MAG: DegT/DnrJ/EryC1/StrS family aminotransferase, partial [Planctomycetota bacterium]
IYNQYCIRVPRRDDVVSLLKDKDIGCAIYYPIPLHLQECFAYLSYKQGDFPHAEKAADEIMAIPVYPELTDEMKDFVADTIIDFLS